jgi:gliding motility associated protien GldN
MPYRLLHIASLLLMASSAVAQHMPTLRQEKYAKSIPVDEQCIEWVNDIYRVVSLDNDSNAVLYGNGRIGLFDILFDMVRTDSVKAYQFQLEGNEFFDSTTVVKVTEILKDYHIPYAVENGVVTVKKEDMPSSEVMEYYVKETVYYDINNSRYFRRVRAICPVIVAEDDFAEEKVRYPLFWLEYKDVQPALALISMTRDNINLGVRMTYDDFFTLNMYKGEIYKTYNVFGKTLQQLYPDEEQLSAIRRGIEEKLTKMIGRTYNIYLK